MDDDPKFLIGQRIKKARKQRKFSQKKLGSKVGVSYQQIQKIESGKNQTPAIRLLQISIILGKPLDYFYRDARAKLAGKPLLSPATREAEIDADEAIYKLGLVLSNIEDKGMRDCVIKLAKRHRKIAAGNSD